MPNHSMYTLCLVTRQAKSPTITKCHHHAHDMDEHGTEKKKKNSKPSSQHGYSTGGQKPLATAEVYRTTKNFVLHLHTSHVQTD